MVPTVLCGSTSERGICDTCVQCKRQLSMPGAITNLLCADDIDAMAGSEGDDRISRLIGPSYGMEIAEEVMTNNPTSIMADILIHG